jgi:hypothetical protein
VAENVFVLPFGLAFSASETGVLVYRAVPELGLPGVRRLTWRDRKGNYIGEVETPAKVGTFRLSHDGKIAIDDRLAQIWVIGQPPRGVPNRLTANTALNSYPVFSPDGNQIVFSAWESGAFMLYQKSFNGRADEVLLSGGITTNTAEDWSKAGIVFGRSSLDVKSIDIWFLAMPGKKPSLYLHNGFRNIDAQVSPDGRYIAYATNKSGRFQIVVQPFPDPAGKQWTVTEKGGREPIWSHDGRELYYLAPDGNIMAVSIRLDPIFQQGPTSELFQIMPITTSPELPGENHYAVSEDDHRFLVASGPDPSAPVGDSTSITVVLNWTAALGKK